MPGDFVKSLDAFIQNEGATSSEPAFCTGWLLICEWTDGDGGTWLEEHRRADLTDWKRLGILYYVTDTPGIGVDTDDDE